mgnify:CR=1 FL=1
MANVKEWVTEDTKYHKRVHSENLKSIATLQGGMITKLTRTKMDNKIK